MKPLLSEASATWKMGKWEIFCESSTGQSRNKREGEKTRFEKSRNQKSEVENARRKPSRDMRHVLAQSLFGWRWGGGDELGGPFAVIHSVIGTQWLGWLCIMSHTLQNFFSDTNLASLSHYFTIYSVHRSYIGQLKSAVTCMQVCTHAHTLGIKI